MQLFQAQRLPLALSMAQWGQLRLLPVLLLHWLQALPLPSHLQTLLLWL
jgi:hypothetical protein